MKVVTSLLAKIRASMHTLEQPYLQVSIDDMKVNFADLKKFSTNSLFYVWQF